MNEVFSKFVALQFCSSEEFQIAKTYYETDAKISEKNKFLQAILRILHKCFDKMLRDCNYDFTYARNIYRRYGLNDEDFLEYVDFFFRDSFFHKLMSKYELIIRHRNIEVRAQLFEEVKQVNWDRTGIKKIAQKHQITQKQLNELVSDYVTNILKLDKSNYARLKKCYSSFISFLHSSQKEYATFKMAYEYFKKFATKKEQEQFKEVSLQIIETVKRMLSNISQVSSYLSSIYFMESNLYLLANEFSNDSKLLFDITKLYQPYYDTCTSLSWDRTSIKEKAKEKGMSYEEYVQMAKDYATRILHVKDINEEIGSIRGFQHSTSNLWYAPVLEQILDTNDIYVYSLLFQENHIATTDIKRYARIAHKHDTEEEQLRIEKDLLTKYQKYVQTTKVPPKYNEDLYTEFAYQDITLEEFCELHNLNIPYFIECTSKIQNSHILSLIKNRIASYRKTVSSSDKNNYRNQLAGLVDAISSGVSYQDVLRPFDLIDYFILFKNIDYRTIKYRYLENGEASLLRAFFQPLYFTIHIDRNAILNSYLEYSPISSENGMPTIHTGRIITLEEKQYVLDFMEKHQIPMLDVLFHITLRRYVNGTLGIYNEEKLVLQ